MNHEVNVIALVKGKERYVFLYNDRKRQDMIEHFSLCASDPEQSFSWRDAAVLTQKALREKRAAELTTARKTFQKRVARKKSLDVSPCEFFNNASNDDLFD